MIISHVVTGKINKTCQNDIINITVDDINGVYACIVAGIFGCKILGVIM